MKKLLKTFWPEMLFFTLLGIFSWWLMWHTFDSKNGTLYIAAKAWSDFAANLPLIRSFSWGENFPPQYPLFPGEPIHYHFLFYFLVGHLEKIGLPIGWALNLPSFLGFWGLAIGLYLLTKLIFQKRVVAVLATLFFLFNGSLSFLEFFRLHPLSPQTPAQIIQNTAYPSFGPYDGKTVSAFWNLNIFTNQRHLAPGYFFVILAIYLLLRTVRQNRSPQPWLLLFLGLGLGFAPFYHKVVFVVVWIILLSFLLYFPQLRRSLLLVLIGSTLMAVPQITYQMQGAVNSFSLHPGYLISPPLTPTKVIDYWVLNLGLSLFLIPLGVLLADRLGKKIFLSILPLFLIGNLFQFSPEIAANHKFFNLFLIIGNMFSAFALYRLWEKNFLGKIIAPLLFFFLVFSGIIDLFPLKNDYLILLKDAPGNPDVEWIKNQTLPTSVFLNSSFLYHPASVAGRKIFFGWPYFSWSAGYDLNQRGPIYKEIYENQDKTKTCQMLKENKIDFFTAEDVRGNPDLPAINLDFFQKNFIPSYTNPVSGFQIYKTKINCP